MASKYVWGKELDIRLQSCVSVMSHLGVFHGIQMFEEVPNVLNFHPNVLLIALPSCTAVEVFQIKTVKMVLVRFRLH